MHILILPDASALLVNDVFILDKKSVQCFNARSFVVNSLQNKRQIDPPGAVGRLQIICRQAKRPVQRFQFHKTGPIALKLLLIFFLEEQPAVFLKYKFQPVRRRIIVQQPSFEHFGIRIIIKSAL